jgi:hypothetical protein
MAEALCSRIRAASSSSEGPPGVKAACAASSGERASRRARAWASARPAAESASARVVTLSLSHTIDTFSHEMLG